MTTPETLFKEQVQKIAETVAKEKASAATQDQPPVNTTEPKVETEKKVEPPTPTEPAKPNAEKDLSSDELIAHLKKSGIDVSSLDELKSKVAPPKKEKSEEESLTEALEYGVKNNKIKLDEYNKAVQTKTAADKDLVYANFAEKQKEKNPKISDEEIQSRFNKKYSADVKIEEIKDELGEVTDRKPVYILDEDEIKAEAESLRNKAWSPIESIKKDYGAYQEQQSFFGEVQKELESIKTKIPKAIKIEIGDNESLDYEIDPAFEKQVTETLLNNYANARLYAKEKGIKWDESFDLNKAVQDVAWNICGKNIMQIYAKQRYDAGMLEGLKDFKNPTKKTLETLNREGKGNLPPETEAQIAERFANELKWKSR